MSGRIFGGALAAAAALAGLAAIATGTHAAPTPANNPMKLCGARYQAAKAGGTLPAGETWPHYLAQCRATLAPTGALASQTPKAVRPARTAAAAGGGRQAAIARERQCGAEWRAAKDAGKTPAGQTWPRYWSQCNARLK